jgi:glycolate oxidase FAD binding subunit
VDGVAARAVAAPGDADQVAALLKAADEAGAAVAPWGGGTHQGLGNVPERIDLVLSTGRLDRVIAHEPADMTCMAEAGIRLSDLQAVLGRAGQFLPIDPPDDGRATLGGVLSANVSGPMRLAHGWPRDAVIGTKVALVSGRQARSGGRVVKNVAGFDLNKLYVGALGTLGVLVEVALKVLPVPEHRATFSAAFATLDGAAGAIRAIMRSDLLPCALELLCPRAAARISEKVPLPGRGFSVLFRAEGFEETVRHQMDRARDLFGREGALEVAALEGAGEPAVWGAVRHFRRTPGPPPSVLCKASVPITGVREVFAAANDLRGAGCETVAHAGNGIVLCGFDLESPDRTEGAAGAVTALRSRAAELGGNLVVEAAPPSVKSRVDVWGEPGPELRLMRGIKAEYDPKRTLNPGRFVGGI